MLRRPGFTAAALSAAGIGVCFFACERSAHASPRPLPVTYNYETNGEGEGEVEQYADLSPVRALQHNTTGVKQTYLATQFQTEYEYGITDRLELGLYVTIAPFNGFIDDNAHLLEGTGTKQRLRYRFADEGVLPIDIGVYGEVSENETTVSFEGKVILQKRFGNLRAIANAVVEHEWNYDGTSDWEISPSAGLTYQVTPVVNPGVEYWVNAEWPDVGVHPRPMVLGPNHYVGPVMLFDFGKIWWSTGAYLRVSDFGNTPELADNFGAVYFRTVIGIGL